MSISSEITLLNNTKQAIKASINAKGGSITDSTPFADYSTAIDNLPSGGGSGNPVLTSVDVSDFSGTTFNRVASYITDVTIPSGVTSFNDYAFENCTGLTSVTIPSSVTSIGVYCFSNCTGLTSVTLPTGSISIGNGAFYGCTALTSVNVSSLEDWFQKGFYMGTYDSYSAANPLTQSTATLYANGTAITGTLTIPNSLTTITGGSFNKYTKITSVNIHNSVTTIGRGAFYRCTGLTGKLTIPNSVTTINTAAFYGCTGLTSVEIGSGVTSFGYTILQGCTGLTSITITATTPPTLNSNAFDDTNNCPIYVPAASVDTYKAATNWSTYASRIYPIQQVATVDGNPVYNYDLGMTSTDTITNENMAKMPAGTSLELAEGITWAGGATAFSNYTNLTLPSTFSTFGDLNMLDGLTTVTCKATTPPMAERNQIGGSSLTAIYVPAASVDTYKAAGGWSDYASIIQAIPAE